MGAGITPGPWLAAASDTHVGRMAVWADGGMGGIEQVCILPPPFVAVEANAKAIAAVPAMVAALQRVTELVGDAIPVSSLEDMETNEREAASVAFDALRKAGVL